MNYARLGLISVMASLILAGCGNDAKPPRVTPPAVPPVPPQPPVVDNSIPEDFRGLWLAPAYGEAVDINADTISIYSYTSDFCLLDQQLINVDKDTINSLVRREGDNLLDFGSYGIAEHHAPGKMYSPVTALPSSCLTNLIERVGEVGYEADPERDAMFFAQAFEEYYLDFDLHNVDWSAVTQELLAAVSQQTSELALFTLFFEAIDDVDDGHVSLEYQDLQVGKETTPGIESRLLSEYIALNNLQPPLTDAQFDEAETYTNANINLFSETLREYLPDNTEFNFAANDNFLWFEMNDIGYIFIGGMGLLGTDGTLAGEIAAVDSVMNTALTEMRDTRGVIVDVRLNGGGFDFVSLAIAGHFTNIAYTGYTKQARLGDARTPLVEAIVEPRGETYTGPVMLLTSPSTVSAAETFTIAMRALPHVTIVGEPTHGALSDILSKTLPNGIEVNMSNEFYLSADGEWFEGNGVPVDVFVPFFTLEQRETLTDLGLETAIQLLPN